MAELATGAVNTLLSVIRNEAQRLGRVRGDVQFIQEEMESMKSFLAHLARTRGEEQDEQVRTWMNQVRILANDCNSCLDVYLYRQNPDFHRPKGGVSHYLWWGWALWWLRQIIAQHRAANQLRELKDRARDVGERRLRYGVKLKDSAGEQPSPGALAVAGARAADLTAEEDKEDDDDEEEDDGDDAHGLALAMLTATTTPDADPSTVDDYYFKKRIVEWMEERSAKRHVVVAAADEEASQPHLMPSIIFVLPADTEDAHALALARDGLAEAQCHFSRSVLVDVPAVHRDSRPLRPQEILYYILQEVELAQSQSLSQPQQGPDIDPGRRTKMDIYWFKKKLLREIKDNIEKMNVDGKFEEIEKTVIREEKGDQLLLQNLEKMKKKKELKGEIKKQSLDVILRLLIKSTAAVAEQDQTRNKVMLKLSPLYDDIIQITAEKLKEHIDVQASSNSEQLLLSSAEYKHILNEVFSTTPTPSILFEDQIKEMVYKVKEMLHELQENKPGVLREAVFKEAAVEKMEKIQRKVREQLKIKGIMHKVQKCLKADERILIILKTHEKYISVWEDTRNTLSLLETSGCFAGAAIMMTATTKKSTRQAEEYLSDPQLELIEYSLVGRYLDTVLHHARKHMDEDKINIVRNILEECGQHEICMNIFTHALLTKPKRRTEELRKLHSILQATPKSQPSIARKMLKFSYKDLSKEHKSCLLYLTIFPPDPEYKIRRSALVGRWVAEGLITTEDWSWSSSVAEAQKCFDSLIARLFVHPANMGATGRIKSFTMDPLVHGFITKIATKQRIVEATRLAPRLARHFSIFNDVRLRDSDTIEKFLKIADLSQFSKLKVLDLERCLCFADNKSYLKDICSKMLRLRYLSLRGTDATWLPHEINKLHELEVLDIQETKIPASETRNILLLKLKRLLAGHIDPNPSSTDTNTVKDFSSVQIPKMVEKMSEVEVLSSVKPKHHQDLRDIGSLSQLKKLGVVINKERHLQDLLTAISDLHLCLQSLSVTLHIAEHKTTPRGSIDSLKLLNPPKFLESLSIRGSTQKGQLLPLLVREDSDKLAKVTLTSTSLKQDDLNALANLGNLRCVRLRHVSYTDTQLTFNKNEFSKLNLLILDSSGIITKISFQSESPEVEKIVIDDHGVAIRHLRTRR